MLSVPYLSKPNSSSPTKTDVASLASQAGQVIIVSPTAASSVIFSPLNASFLRPSRFFQSIQEQLGLVVAKSAGQRLPTVVVVLLGRGQVKELLQWRSKTRPDFGHTKRRNQEKPNRAQAC